MPCPFMGPKWFWTVQIILVEYQLDVTFLFDFFIHFPLLIKKKVYKIHSQMVMGCRIVPQTWYVLIRTQKSFTVHSLHSFDLEINLYILVEVRILDWRWLRIVDLKICTIFVSDLGNPQTGLTLLFSYSLFCCPSVLCQRSICWVLKLEQCTKG